MQNTLQEPDSKTSVLIDTDWAKCEIEECNGLVSLHVPRLEWGVGYYKMYRKLFESIKIVIRNLGYEKITVAFSKEDNRTKLARMFDFKHIGQENGYEVYEIWVTR